MLTREPHPADVKATALLKLVYLEMVGHDMSWASFHVLEVMSSPKYHQKRVGYLGAVQSFRPDTEVLMLATNLLKKVGNPVKAPSFTSHAGIGPWLDYAHCHIATDSDSSSRHHPIAGAVNAGGPAPSNEP
jgi:hypothetical protein